MKWYAEKGLYSFELIKTEFDDFDLNVHFLKNIEHHWFNSYDDAMNFIKEEYEDMNDLDFKKTR